MIGRILLALAVGLVTYLVVWLVLELISFLLPGIDINGHAFGVALGLIAGIVHFVRGHNPVL